GVGGPRRQVGDRLGVEVDGSEGVAHLARIAASAGRVALAELAGSVVAPALDGGIVEDRARVVVAGGEVDDGAAGAEVDGSEGVAHLAGVGATVGGVAKAKLAGAVGAPAADRAKVQKDAGVPIAGGELDAAARRGLRRVDE